MRSDDAPFSAFVRWLKDRRSISVMSQLILTCLVCYSLFGMAFGDVRLFGFRVVHEGIWRIIGCVTTLCAFSLIVIQQLSARPKWRWLEPLAHIREFTPHVLVGAIVAYFATDVLARPFTFLSSGTRGSDLLWITLCVIALRPIIGDWFHRTSIALGTLMIVGLALGGAFLSYLHGHVLWSDDHPSFLYRLALLQDQFPELPFYNTDWNAGYWAKEFYAVGVLNVYFLTLPLRALGILGRLGDIDQAQSYNIIVPYLFLGVAPFSTFLAARLARRSNVVALIAALLALGPSSGFFEWVLKFGTLGFAVSTILFPLTFVLLWRLFFEERRPSTSTCLAVILTVSLSLFWSLSAVVWVPFGVFVVLSLPRVFGANRRAPVLYALLALMVINAPWVSTFVRESRVFEFVSTNRLPGSHAEAVPQTQSAEDDKRSETNLTDSDPKPEPLRAPVTEKGIEKKLREPLSKFHPLLLVFFAPGILAFRRERRLILLMSATVVWLFFLASWGELFKPQLELKRMALMAAFLLTLPAAEGVRSTMRLLEISAERAKNQGIRWISTASIGILIATVIIGVVSVGSFYTNRNPSRFAITPAYFKSFVSTMNEKAGAGRVFFLGFILHEFGSTSPENQDGGHIAPLALWIQRELYAFDFTHAKWSSVDPIPLSYRKRGREGIEEFLDLVNVTTVVTFRREWVRYCLADSRYKEIFASGKLHVYQRETTTSAFLRGEGSAKRIARDRIEVHLKTPSAVIKYRSIPELKLLSRTPGVTLSSEEVFTEQLGSNKENQVRFIRIDVAQDVIDRDLPLILGTP